MFLVDFCSSFLTFYPRKIKLKVPRLYTGTYKRDTEKVVGIYIRILSGFGYLLIEEREGGG